MDNAANRTLSIVRCDFENNEVLPASQYSIGGAIEVTSRASSANGDLYLQDCRFKSNSSGGKGGAISIETCSFTMLGCTLDSNTTQREGGALAWTNYPGSPSSVENSLIDRCTFSGNTIAPTGFSSGNGGAIYNRSTGDKLLIRRSTITGNKIIGAGGGLGGGIYSPCGDLTRLSNTIISGNDVLAGGSWDDIYTSGFCSGSTGVISEGYNLWGGADGMTATSGDQTGIINPLLAPLADNGGLQPTHAILCGSPAIDRGNPSDFTVDQTGASVIGGRRDIGAFEQFVYPPDNVQASNGNASIAASGSSIPQ